MKHQTRILPKDTTKLQYFEVVFFFLDFKHIYVIKAFGTFRIVW